MPKSHPPTLLWTRYPLKISEPSGEKDGARILLAIKEVFDVAAGRVLWFTTSVICIVFEIAWMTQRRCMIGRHWVVLPVGLVDYTAPKVV
jgi:hypothetical protein